MANLAFVSAEWLKVFKDEPNLTFFLWKFVELLHQHFPLQFAPSNQPTDVRLLVIIKNKYKKQVT